MARDHLGSQKVNSQIAKGLYSIRCQGVGVDMMAEKEAQRTSLLKQHRGKDIYLACLHLTGIFKSKGQHTVTQKDTQGVKIMHKKSFTGTKIFISMVLISSSKKKKN